MKRYMPGMMESEAREKYGSAPFVRLSLNENPLGASPKAVAALRDLRDLHLYHDDRGEVLGRLAQRHGLCAEHVLVDNGSNGVARTLFSAFLAAGDEVVLADPTFSFFPKDVVLRDALPVKVPLRDGVHDLDAMLTAVTPRTRILIIVDPNNPTATRVERNAFDRFARALPSNVILLVDQAYREYMPPNSVDGVDYVKSRPATIVLRTHSKLYGLAALRFGYALGDPELIAYAQRFRLPFSVSRAAEIAALAALDDHDFVRRSLDTNDAGKAFLYPAFERLALHAYPSAANFVAVRVPVSATQAYEGMLQRGIVTRNGDDLGMPGRLRITIGTPHQNALVIDALRSLVTAAV